MITSITVRNSRAAPGSFVHSARALVLIALILSRIGPDPWPRLALEVVEVNESLVVGSVLAEADPGHPHIECISNELERLIERNADIKGAPGGVDVMTADLKIPFGTAIG